MNILAKAMEHYDDQRKKYQKLTKKINFIRLILKTSDIERSEIAFYDKDQKEMFKSKFEFVGSYFKNEKMWIWAWGIYYYSKNESYLSRKILNYGLDIQVAQQKTLNKNLIKDYQDVFLKFELVTPRFVINNIVQLDIHIALCSYISRVPFIIPLPVSLAKNINPENIHKYVYNDIYNSDGMWDVLEFVFLLDPIPSHLYEE